MTFSSKAFPSVVYLGGNEDDDSLIPCAGPGDPDPNSPIKIFDSNMIYDNIYIMINKK